MACQKCKQAGKEPKVYRYACEGRWRKVEVCKHHTRRLWQETSIARKWSGNPRRTYTPEQDHFILSNYHTDNSTYRGQHVMQKMAAIFQEKFHIPTTPNMLIGRYHRIKHQMRPTPSLPRLKFMEDWHA